MPQAIHIDGLGVDLEGKGVRIDPGATAWDVLSELGASVSIKHVPERLPELTPDAERFLRCYKPEDPDSVVALYWRHHNLEAEEFDSFAEAKGFLKSSEEYGTLAGEAVVYGDRIAVWD